jgi:hypothetical protein
MACLEDMVCGSSDAVGSALCSDSDMVKARSIGAVLVGLGYCEKEVLLREADAVLQSREAHINGARSER